MAIVASALATCFAGVLGSIIFDIGKDAATTTVDDGFTRKMEDKYVKEHPTLVIGYLGQDAHEGSVESTYFETLQAFADAGSTVLHIDSQFNSNRWTECSLDMPITHCRGDLSFATNDPGILQDLQV